MNWLFKLAIAFDLGLVLVGFCWFGCLLYVVLAGAFALLLIGFVWFKFSFRLFLALLVALVAGGAYFLVYDFNFRVKALRLDGVSEFVNASVVDVKKSDFGKESYVLKIERCGDDNFFVPIMASVYDNKDFKFSYGDKIEAKMSFTAKSSSNEFLFSSARSKNIYLNAKILQLGEVRAGRGVLVDFFRVRADLINAVNFAVEEPANFLVSSIFLGCSSGFPYEIRRAFDCCGLSHIFAVSGLHISILFVSLICCLKFLRASKVITVAILVLFLVGYNVLLGFCVSAIRASLMNFAYFIGSLFNKKLNPIRLLSFVATAILIVWPGSMFSCGFVLSVSSCFGILLFFRRISFAIKRKLLIFSGWPVLFIDLFALSVSAMFFSMFFIMLFFGKISLVAPIVNLIVVPFVPIILIFSGLIAVSGFFGWFAVSKFFGYFCEGIFAEIVILVKFFAKLPFSFIPVRYFFASFVVVGLLAFLLFVFIYARNLLFSKVVALFCCLIIFVPVVNNFVFAKDSSSVSLIGNVSGFSTVINSSGKVIVLNCGGFGCEKNLCNFLDSRGIKRIDFLVFLSNDHKNMNCNIKTIVDCVEVFCVILPQDSNDYDDGKYDYLVKVLAEKNSHLVFAEQAHFVNFPVSMDFVASNKGSGFNCHINLGGLSFSYSLSEPEFQQMQQLRFANVAIVDDVVENYDENTNCGFLISTKPCNSKDKHFCAVPANKISDFLIYGSFIKKTSL